MPKHIVFFIQNFSRPGGSERVASVIANGLDNLGYKVSVVSICGDNTCFFPLNESIELHTLISVPEINNRRSFLSVLFKLHRFYKRNKVDVCIDVFAALSIYTLILKRKFGYKNITWEHFNYKVDIGMNRLGRKLAIRRSDQIVTLTKRDVEFYEEDNAINGQIDYIYNPSPYQNVISSDSMRDTIVMSVGRLTNQKGFDRLIQVWELVEPHTEWELLVFGNGEDKEFLQSQIDDRGLKRIKLLGAVKNIDDYYRRASLYVSTARFEGLPMTMIEAQSFGLPILTFDYDTGPAEIVSDGVDGVIVKRSDESAMIHECAEQMLALINGEKLIEMGGAAKKSSNRFELAPILKKWDEVLKAL